LLAQVGGERLRAGGSVADPEAFGVGAGEPAFGEEAAARLRLRAQQLLGVELRGGPVRLDQPLALPLLVAGHVAALLVAELDARRARQVLDGLREPQVLDPLDEGDDVPALPAAEAVPEVAGRGDVERGGLLVVEGAQALQGAAPGVAELEVLA